MVTIGFALLAVLRGQGKALFALGYRCCNSTVLDGGGFCCLSGLLDECGVCDGDGSSCQLHVVLTAQVPSLLQRLYLLQHKQPSLLIFQVTQSAFWLSGDNRSSVGPASAPATGLISCSRFRDLPHIYGLYQSGLFMLSSPECHHDERQKESLPCQPFKAHPVCVQGYHMACLGLDRILLKTVHSLPPSCLPPSLPPCMSWPS